MKDLSSNHYYYHLGMHLMVPTERQLKMNVLCMYEAFQVAFLNLTFMWGCHQSEEL